MRFLLLVIGLFLALSAFAAEPPVRTIALTFDDAARGDTQILTGPERTSRLIDALRQSDVDGAMFFVTSRNTLAVGPTGTKRLQAYTDAGHDLANHSHSHQWLWKTDVADYIDDLDRASEFLAQFDNVVPYYRFPFLDEGRSLQKRDALRAALSDRHLRNGYVTVDTYDWYLDSLAQNAYASGNNLDFERIGKLYVDVLVRSTEFYDAMAQDLLGRSPHHVLLLHENDLAALFVGDLVTELRRRGFRIIPATVAFQDPIADREPDTVFLGQGRIAALAHEAGKKPADLISPTESEPYLKRRFENEVLSDD